MIFTCLGVEPILAMQNLQPKIDAIKKRYAGNHVMMEFEFEYLLFIFSLTVIFCVS